jgi:hypothetical protein
MLPKKISDLLEARQPYALCDACIAQQLGAPLAKVRPVTEAFGVTNDFTRVTSHCPSCGQQAWTMKAGGTQ